MTVPIDNTTIGSAVIPGDVLSTEDMPVGAQRGIDAVPTTDYKVPRSKIAVGQYGIDKGDASPTNALAVSTYVERRLLEDALIEHTNNGRSMLVRRGYERVTLMDRRGGNGHRGVR